MADVVTMKSPKRKRSEDNDIGRGPSPLRLRTDAPEGSEIHSSSPRSHISNELRSLHIEPDHAVSRLSFRGKAASPSPGGPPPATLGTGSDDFSAGSITTISSSNPLGVRTSAFNYSHTLGENETLPATPPLNPSSPADAPRTISPLPSMAQTPVKETSPNVDLPPLPTTTTRSAPPLRIKSPPPSAVTSDLVWSESEITGHDPTDPADDGYGINGIGFRPTPAIAAARVIKRRQQVSDWKARETRDARNKRAERRGRGIPMARTASSGSITGDVTCPAPTRKVVRFVEG